MNEDKATRYQRLRRRASVAATAMSSVFLVVLLAAGWSVRLREVVSGLVGGSFFLTVAGYVVLLALASEGLQLPLAYYRGVTLERRFGVSSEPIAQWWSAHLRSGVVVLVLGLLAALLLWFLLRWTPEYWWLLAAVSASLLLVVMAGLAPVLLLPFFYECRPLQRPELASRLVALAERAGAKVHGVFEWRMGERTRRGNAALTGLWRTRRILLSDTLLAEHSDEEVEVVVAHELGHQVHHDIWRGIALEATLLGLGFYLTDQALVAFGEVLGFAGKDDIAALPLLLLSAGSVSLTLLPLSNAAARAHERRADRYALSVTRNPDAFVTAMRRLGERNLADPRPSWLAEVLFHTHPTVAARIAAAERWTPPDVSVGPVRPRRAGTG
jgi:STE24 endopeptidase